jgi:hypothetical protein
MPAMVSSKNWAYVGGALRLRTPNAQRRIRAYVY